MKTSELFRKTLREYLDKQGHGSQSRLADEIGIDRKNLNGFLNGRKMLSESKREEIAEKLGYSYVDFLILGMKMFGKEIQNEKSIFIDFSVAPDLFELLKQKSKQERRHLDMQIVYDLERIYKLTGKDEDE